MTALLVKDEAQRYLPEVLDHHARYGPLVILDDHSTDGTFELCQKHPAVIALERTWRAGMWGNESPSRQQLWNLAQLHGDWILVCDGDQLLMGDPRDLIKSTVVNSWAFVLYDGWEDRAHYRVDGLWNAHNGPRPWLFCPERVPVGYVPEWSLRGIHTGHAPINFPHRVGIAPKEYWWHHLGYIHAGDRQAKYQRYRSQSHQLSPGERLHAESIIQPATLRRFDQPVKLCIGGPVRKPVEVLKAHLETLAWQDIPQGVEVTYCFVSDYPEPDPAETLLQEFVQQRGGVVLSPPQRTPVGDFNDQSPITHQWTPTAMNRVGEMKRHIFAWALEQGSELVWLVDSDLLLDRTTLTSLYADGRVVTSAVYWTVWNRNAEKTIHAAPQVWLAPVYQLSRGPYYPEAEFRRKLSNRELIPVGGLGACTLIHQSVIRKGVGFAKPANFPTGGLWDGEDRHFCEHARRLHVDLHADSWPDIFHVYHPDDVQWIPAMLERLGKVHPSAPQAGDLVNLNLKNLEDMTAVPWRGVIGRNHLTIELEDAVLSMSRGETRTVRVNFPADYPEDALRGQSRLIQVALIDCKPFGLAPVLENEFHKSPMGVVADATTFTPEQNELLRTA